MIKHKIFCLILLLVFLPGCRDKEEGTEPTTQETEDTGIAAETTQTVPAETAYFDLSPGLYEGSAEEVIRFTMIIVSENGSPKVKEIGYKFAASLDVEHAFLESEKPFGTVEKGKLLFEFPVFVKFSPNTSLTTDSGGTTALAPYKAEVSIENEKQLRCVLTEISELDENYKGFTFRNIGLASPPENKKMLKQYNITLKKIPQ